MPEILYPLILLVCPLGMGLMMWMMMRGGVKPHPDPTTSDELATLRNEIEHLRTFQAGPTDTSVDADHR